MRWYQPIHDEVNTKVTLFHGDKTSNNKHCIVHNTLMRSRGCLLSSMYEYNIMFERKMYNVYNIK